MPRNQRRRRAPRRRPRVTQTGGRTQATKKRLFNYRVKQVVKSLMEHKHKTVRSNINIVPYTAANAVTCDNINVIGFDPVINQGASVDGRVGNVILMTSCKFRFMLTMKEFIDTGNQCPQFVRMIFFYDREDENNFPTPYTNANFVDALNGSQGLRGDVTDTFYKYNTDRYRILGQRTYKIGYANNGQNTTPSVVRSQLYTNNDSPMVVKGTVNCSKWILKRQKFNDNLGTAMGRKLYCLIMTLRQDGLVNISANPVVQINYEQEYKYVDA